MIKKMVKKMASQNNHIAINSIEEFKQLLKTFDMKHSYIFFNEDMKPIDTLYIEPSTIENFYFVTIIYGARFCDASIKPYRKDDIPLILAYFHFTFQNSLFITVESEQYRKNEWAYEKEPLNLKNNSDVYFIQSVIGGPIKIGTSLFPRGRLVDLQYYSPFKLRIIGTIKGEGYKKEAELHKKFRVYRLHGEWFEPAEALLNYIKTIQEGSN